MCAVLCVCVQESWHSAQQRPVQCRMLQNAFAESNAGQVQRHTGSRVHVRWLARTQGVLSRLCVRERAGGVRCGGLASECVLGELVGSPYRLPVFWREFF